MNGLRVDYNGINMLIDENYSHGFKFDMIVAINRAIEKLQAEKLTPILIFLDNNSVRVHSAEIKQDNLGHKTASSIEEFSLGKDGTKLDFGELT